MDADGELEEDELEYYVTFPAAVAPQFRDGTFEEAEKEPVVLLFGWAGCLDRHLAKYAEMYKELGCVTIRYTSPVNHVFFTPRDLLDVADQLIDLITDLTLEVHPLLFHSFSNGGSLVYLCLTRRLRERRLALDVRAALFDSGPLPPRITSGWKALQICVRGPRWYRWLVLLCFCVMAAVWIPWFYLWDSHSALHPWTLRHSPERWPQMFLYSKTDSITPDTDVEQFMEARRARGVTVTSHKFESSPHVLHLRHHPDIYRQEVAAFLARVCQPNSSCSSDGHRGGRAAAGQGGGASSCRPGAATGLSRVRRPGSGDKL